MSKSLPQQTFKVSVCVVGRVSVLIGESVSVALRTADNVASGMFGL